MHHPRFECLDGKSYTFKELVDNNVQELWVYSRDKNGDIVPAKAINPGLTRKNAELVEVELDNGEVIRCTPDHQFMLSDGSYKRAINLSGNDELSSLSLTIKVSKVSHLNYTEDVYDLSVPDYENFALDAGVFVHNCLVQTGRWRCFTGDTKVLTTCGTFTFKQLVENNVQSFTIFARSDSGYIVRSTAINPHITKVAEKLAVVTLSNKSVIRCTPDHEFRLANGKYKHAEDLTESDQLSSLSTIVYVISVEIIDANE